MGQLSPICASTRDEIATFWCIGRYSKQLSHPARALIVVLTNIYLIICDGEHFSHAYWPSVCLLWKNVYLNPLENCHFDFWFSMLLSCSCSLCILDINPLSDNMICKHFYYSVSCFFILLIVCIDAKNAFNFDEV